jgi:fucose permease
MSVLQPHASGNRFTLLLFIHFTFVLIGIVTTLLGVIMPALSGRLNLNDAQSGTFFTVQFGGSLLGTLVSGFLWKRIGFQATLSIGLTAMTIGVFGLGWLNWQGTALCIFLNGIGIGLTIPTTNLLVAALNHERQAAALNILNFAWGLGALFSPTLFGLLGTQQDIRLPVGVLSVLLLVAAFCFLLFLFVSITITNPQIPAPQSSPTKIWRMPFAIITAVLLFFYVGTESSLGGWITAYSLRLEAAETTLWTPTIFAFWTSFLLGRLFAPLGLKRIKASVYVLFCLVIAAFGIFLLLATTQLIFVTVGVIFAGFGLAPVFPTVLAEFTRRFGEEGARQANWLFIGSTLGGAFLTWSVGFLSNAFGSLQSGFFAVFVCCLLMIALQAYLYFSVQNKI